MNFHKFGRFAPNIASMRSFYICVGVFCLPILIGIITLFSYSNGLLPVNFTKSYFLLFVAGKQSFFSILFSRLIFNVGLCSLLCCCRKNKFLLLLVCVLCTYYIYAMTVTMFALVIAYNVLSILLLLLVLVFCLICLVLILAYHVSNYYCRCYSPIWLESLILGACLSLLEPLLLSLIKSLVVIVV